VLEWMKADPRTHDVPVLMISAVDEIKSVVRCIKLNAEDFLPKPFDPVLLRARVGAYLKKKRLHDQEKTLLRTLKQEHDRSERLLLNVLPQQISERLKKDPAAIAETFPD